TMSSVKDYDLMFITDATGSMSIFLSELRSALPQIFDLVRLTKLIDRISVLAFRDYCDNELIEWSGWSSVLDTSNVIMFAEQLTATGGGDTPEAVKTGLWEASKKVEKPTICIMYVDAPPHHKYKGSDPGENYAKEIAALGPTNAQWCNICRLLRDREIQATNGQCVQIGTSSVVRATIGILLNLAGVEFEYDEKCANVTKLEFVNFEQTLVDDSDYDTKQRHTINPVNITTIEDIKDKIGNPVANFHSSEEYKELVFKVFHNLLRPERVLAFTYNTLFGKLWREICKERKDPRRDALVERLGHTVTLMDHQSRAILQSFIDDSYDNTSEIESIILPYGSVGPFYVIDHEEDLSRKALFEIGLSCAPQAVQSVLQLLTGLRITTQLPNQKCNLSYIPVNLPSNLKFKLLPHLMRPGTMFSLRLSAIMASIAKISGSILRDDATKFLNEIRGKWIDFELPECNSVDFARLMMKIKDEHLTEMEQKHLLAVIVLSSLKRSKENQIEVEISYTSYKTKRPDYKDECKTCRQWRSVTLLTDESCALCLESREKTSLEPRTIQNESWMCECKTCLVHYAVYDVDALKCKAKCHFCRKGEKAPFVSCKSCNNKFMYQRSLPMPNYICAVCENNCRVGQKRKLTLAKYIQQNGARFIGVDIDPTTFFDDKIRIFKMKVEEKLKAIESFENIAERDIENHSIPVGDLRKEVWNVKEIQQEVRSFLFKLKVSQCMICFEEFPLDKLGPICGLTKSGCSINACRKCLQTWYNQLAPGRICQPALLVCCYCKRVPTIKVVRQFNRQLCTLMNTMDVSAFDPSYIYAWCMNCFVIKQAVPRECGREQQEIIDFKCADCIVTFDQTIFKECPKCNVPTEKYGGCNHIACTNTLIDGNKCDAHWCWICGALSTESEIYTHLSSVHGGYFSPEDIQYFDEEMHEQEAY
ncbi:putative ariadne-like RING finger protein, partial [Pseudolycoriella hygida]